MGGLPRSLACTMGALACALGCVRADLVECTDGVLCPPGTVCAGERGCLSEDEIERCGNSVVDTDIGEECDDGAANADAPDACRTTCTNPRCGDAIIDPSGGEVCDDGNLEAGDGCRPNCLSETCGNAVVEETRGEECDDGNDRSRDGCGATCLREVPRWRPVGGEPPGRLLGNAGYDLARGRLVVFGGEDLIVFWPDTWELGAGWSRETTSGPRARSAGAAVYDAARRELVLFGGGLGGGFADTWVWNGRWRRAAVTGPTARIYNAMAYDSRRQRVVMFGGADNSGPVDDTWEWDGASWTERTPTTVPVGRESPALVYDPSRDVTVLHGGRDGIGDTWEWDGSDWTHRTNAGPAITGGAAAYDPVGRRVLINGGILTGMFVDNTWVWDGATWTGLAGGPSSRYGHSAVTDPQRQDVAVFGGLDDQATALAEVWRFDGTAWSPPAAVSEPTPRYGHGLVYDALRGVIVAFGGSAGGAGGQTWEWDGAWRLVPGTGPSPRFDHAMTYDPVRGGVIVFGGRGASVLGDGWVRVGTTWAPLGGLQPAARIRPALAPDAAGHVVMFAGHDGGAGWFADTWVLTATGWEMRSPATSPPARARAAIAYDPVRGRTILFGGVLAGGVSYTDDTWAWDGTAWTEIGAASVPSARSDAAMTFDADRGTIVMHGGLSTLGPLDDLWELVGDDWVEIVAAQPPRGRWGHGLAHDARRRQVVLFGGYSTQMEGDTVALRWDSDGRVEACDIPSDHDADTRIGCADADCWATCTPQCPPNAAPASCPVGPRCGDGTCDPLESCGACEADCGACPAVCGDARCSPGETACPGDC